MKELKDGWEAIKAEKGPELGLLQTRFDYLKNPRNKKEVKVLVIEGLDAVNVITLTKDKKIVLVKQLRFGTRDISIEPPGGLMEVNETQLEAAKRELREETGYTGSEWEYLTTKASQPVFMDNYIHTFILKDAQLTHPKELDEAEDIEIIELTIQEVKSMLIKGEFIHPHAHSSISHFMIKEGYLR
ncbi:MAG: NUDIX hydrolase [Saprospiraceae bacterium]